MRVWTERRFFIASILLCLGYLGFELFFNAYAMFSVDEFWFAHRIYEYKAGLPYQDFAPYKTVLGYYLLLLPLLASTHILTSLLVVKNTLALLNAGIFLGSSWWLKRYFSSTAILTGLALLFSAEIVLCYSTNIRVDLLGYWFCFFALLFLLENRMIWAGVFIGLGFITTQKAIWYLFAGNVSLVIFFLMNYFNPSTYSPRPLSFRSIVYFNLASFSVIFSYLIFWSLLTDSHTVLQSVFFEASAMYQLDWYGPARHLFWSAITLYNPLLFLLSPLAIISLFVTFSSDTHYQKRLLIVVYALSVLACLIPYKQVFPYYMQVTIPVFLILYIAFADWLFKLFKSKHVTFLLPPPYLYGLLGIYLLSTIGLIIFLNLPDIYLMICMIPFSLAAYLFYTPLRTQSPLCLQLILISLVFVGGIYPLTLLSIKLLNIDGKYQKAHIDTMHHLLSDGSDYIAGIELIYNKTQPIAGMRHLMGPAIDYLYKPTDNLRTVMLASLYEDPNATLASVIQAIEKSKVKFYVNNYRMSALPPELKAFLATRYAHWWGSIYLYAPFISPHEKKIRLQFSGHYQLESKKAVRLQHHLYQPNSLIYLTKGEYASYAKTAYRLKLIPEGNHWQLPAIFAQDNADKVIF